MTVIIMMTVDIVVGVVVAATAAVAFSIDDVGNLSKLYIHLIEFLPSF